MSAKSTDATQRLVGLHFGTRDEGDPDYPDWWYYNLGLIAYNALEALKIAVLAVEQSFTGEKLMRSLDVGDFYSYLSAALEEENGQGVASESGEMASLQDEIQALIDIMQKARRIAKHPDYRRGVPCADCDGSGFIRRRTKPTEAAR